MTNGRLTHGTPIWCCSSGPEMPSVAGTNLSLPPIFCHSESPSVTKALVEYAVGVIVVPTAYTSGPLPDTTEVWILVSSSLAVANVSQASDAPVCALNLSATDFCQSCISCGYWVLAPISTCKVLPEALPPPLSSSPPQAAMEVVSAIAPASATRRSLREPIVVSLVRARVTRWLRRWHRAWQRFALCCQNHLATNGNIQACRCSASTRAWLCSASRTL